MTEIGPTSSPEATISSSQRSAYGKHGTIIQIGVAGLLLVMLLIMYWTSHDALGMTPPKLETVPERLAYTIRVQIFSVFPMIFSLNHVMWSRFFITAARNPLAGTADQHVAKANRILVNTTEQLILSFLNLIIFATAFSADYLFLVPFVVFLFLFGRIIFFVGYMIHAKYRIFGLMFTVAPTMILFIANLSKVIGLS